MNPQSPGLRHKVAEGQQYFEGIAAAVVSYQLCEPEHRPFKEADLSGADRIFVEGLPR
jgi:hypothetical protein